MNSEIRIVSKGKKGNKLRLKVRFVSEKKKNMIISEMSSCNVLQRTGPDFCVTNNFQGIFTHFRFIIFIQERINTYSGLSLFRTRKGPTNLFEIEKVQDRENYRKYRNFC